VAVGFQSASVAEATWLISGCFVYNAALSSAQLVPHFAVAAVLLSSCLPATADADDSRTVLFLLTKTEKKIVNWRFTKVLHD